MPSRYFLYAKKIYCEDTHELCVGYMEYLSSKHWDRLRKSIINEKSKCEKCGNSGVLQLHHVSYENLGNETRKDFKVLCPDCHNKVHGRIKPKKPKQSGNGEKTVKKSRKRRASRGKNHKKKAVVFGQSNLKEATPDNLIAGAYVDKFSPSCAHCFQDSGIQWCDLGYKHCPFLKCGDYKRKDDVKEL